MMKREEMRGLLIGLFVVMLVVWLTLPTERNQEIAKSCYETCKKVVDEKGLEIGIFSGPSFFSAFEDCYDACMKEINK